MHLNKIRDITSFELRNMFKERTEKLEKEYKKNPYIKNANVKFEGEAGRISLELNFEADTEGQDIVSVFEYGGIIKRKDGKYISIEPGYYIRNILTQGK